MQQSQQGTKRKLIEETYEACKRLKLDKVDTPRFVEYTTATGLSVDQAMAHIHDDLKTCELKPEKLYSNYVASVGCAVLAKNAYDDLWERHVKTNSTLTEVKPMVEQLCAKKLEQDKLLVEQMEIMDRLGIKVSMMEEDNKAIEAKYENMKEGVRKAARAYGDSQRELIPLRKRVEDQVLTIHDYERRVQALIEEGNQMRARLAEHKQDPAVTLGFAEGYGNIRHRDTPYVAVEAPETERTEAEPFWVGKLHREKGQWQLLLYGLTKQGGDTDEQAYEPWLKKGKLVYTIITLNSVLGTLKVLPTNAKHVGMLQQLIKSRFPEKVIVASA